MVSRPVIPVQCEHMLRRDTVVGMGANDRIPDRDRWRQGFASLSSVERLDTNLFDYTVGMFQVLDVELVSVNMFRLVLSNTQACFSVICSAMGRNYPACEDGLTALKRVINSISLQRGRSRVQITDLVSHLVYVSMVRVSFDIDQCLNGMHFSKNMIIPSFLVLTDVMLMSRVVENLYPVIGCPARRNFFVNWRHYSFGVLKQLQHLEPGSNIGVTIPVRTTKHGLPVWELFDGQDSKIVLCPEELQNRMQHIDLSTFQMMHVLVAKPLVKYLRFVK